LRYVKHIMTFTTDERRSKIAAEIAKSRRTDGWRARRVRLLFGFSSITAALY